MLARLTELPPDIIETALSSLITCNIMTMISINDLGDTAYQMSDLPRAYLRRIDRLSSEAATKIAQTISECAANYRASWPLSR